MEEAVENRKKIYDSGSKLREFSVGDQVLVRIPGLDGKMEESWKGPYIILKRHSILIFGLNICPKCCKSYDKSLKFRQLR